MSKKKPKKNLEVQTIAEPVKPQPPQDAWVALEADKALHALWWGTPTAAPTIPGLYAKASKKPAKVPYSKTDAGDFKSGYLGHTYPVEPKEDWLVMEMADGENKTIHKLELDLFSSDYRKCILDCKWRGSSGMCHVAGDTDNFVYPENAKKAGWISCHDHGYWGPKDRFFKAYSNNNEMVAIAKGFEDQYFTCDHLGRLFHRGCRVRIEASKKYKLIASWVLKNTSLFAQCCECGGIHEAKDIKQQKAGWTGCDKCFAIYKHKGVIFAYNDHSHPEPIFTPVLRYGHKITKDGAIRATNKQEEVKTLRLFGAEAETEISIKGAKKDDLNRFVIASQIKEALGEDFVTVKEDGTLLMNGHYNNNAKDSSKNKPTGPLFAGFEIASAPADLAAHRSKWWKIVQAAAYPHLRAWDTDTCGFHVHVNRASLTTLQIGRMLRFINDGSNAKFIHKIAGRGSDRFCRYLGKEVSDALHPERVVSPEEDDAYNRSRRVALNLANEMTVEFRIFRGTINPKHIIRNIEFCDAVCDFCYPASRSLLSIDNYPEFIHFVGLARKKWPILAAWFVYQKDLTIRKWKDGADISKFTIQPDMVVEDVHPSHVEPEPELDLVAS